MVCSLQHSVCSNLFSAMGVGSILLDGHNKKENGKLSLYGIGVLEALPLGVTRTTYSLSRSLNICYAIQPSHPHSFKHIYPTLEWHAKKIKQ